MTPPAAGWDAEAAARELEREWMLASSLAEQRAIIARHLTLARSTAPPAEAMREAAAKRLVILESPYAGDIEANTRYARACLRDSLLRGEAPIASHLLYTQPGVLDDMIGEERQLGIDAGLAWKTVATASVVYTDHGISRGMQYGIDAATAAGLPVERRHLSAEALPLPPAQPPAPSAEAMRERLREVDECLRTGSGAARAAGDWHAYVAHMRAIIAGEAKGEALAPAQPPAVGDAKVWRCFHCGETFTDQALAAEHFGGDERGETLCRLTAGEGGLAAIIRSQENELARYRAEDSDADRAMHGMIADHSRALIREEEKGYEKGLADGRELALSSIPAPEIEALRKVVTVELERDEWNHRVATHLRSFLARTQSPPPAGEGK